MSLPQTPDDPRTAEADVLRMAATLASLENAIKKMRAEYRRKLAAFMSPGDTRRPAVDAGAVEVALGTVSYSQASYELRVNDEESFLAWAEEHYAHEVEAIPERVIPAHKRIHPTLLANCRVNLFGEPMGPKGEPVPGVIYVRTKEPTISVTANHDNVAAVWPVLFPAVQDALGEIGAGE